MKLEKWFIYLLNDSIYIHMMHDKSVKENGSDDQIGKCHAKPPETTGVTLGLSTPSVYDWPTTNSPPHTILFAYAKTAVKTMFYATQSRKVSLRFLMKSACLWEASL